MLELEVAACTVFRARECTLYLHTIESYYFTPGGHLGRDKTIKKIESRFYWKNMNAEIRAYIQVCDKCQGVNAKFTKANAKLHPIPVESKMWHQVT